MLAGWVVAWFIDASSRCAGAEDSTGRRRLQPPGGVEYAFPIRSIGYTAATARLDSSRDARPP